MKAIEAGSSDYSYAENRVGAFTGENGRTYNTAFRYELPELYDANGDNVRVSMFLGDASEFLMYDEENGVLLLIPGSLPPPLGSYDLVITLKDDSSQGSRTSYVKFKFEVTDGMLP